MKKCGGSSTWRETFWLANEQKIAAGMMSEQGQKVDKLAFFSDQKPMEDWLFLVFFSAFPASLTSCNEQPKTGFFVA